MARSDTPGSLSRINARLGHTPVARISLHAARTRCRVEPGRIGAPVLPLLSMVTWIIVIAFSDGFCTSLGPTQRTRRYNAPFLPLLSPKTNDPTDVILN